ncbi:nitrile hydratase [Planktotalea frisia]|uniref:Nitrile hydratase subunit beta n=1 Tax=Planktotalea frisia TaxID=696762 RepID=A0A1L9NXX3_9RHOB|nr:SH3-like domain-containing protein [Planktotalea frisia]OJI94053.1 nitrile hydratase subunit beta [Planktotalea frisia]PZX28898.1 nitrile hydratase [Planktotalea frisia]
MATQALDNNVLPVGAKVRIRSIMPPGHVRAPAYVRGKTGDIERVIAPFKNPEQLAYGLPAAEQILYRVSFSAVELWGDEAENPEDRIEAEIYAHWIEELETANAT